MADTMPKALQRQLYTTDGWKKRRRVLFGALYFIAGCIVYLLLFAPDDELRRTIAAALVGLAAVIIPAYVFGAMLDDKSKRETLAAADVEPAPEEEREVE